MGSLVTCGVCCIQVSGFFRLFISCFMWQCCVCVCAFCGSVVQQKSRLFGRNECSPLLLGEPLHWFNHIVTCNGWHQTFTASSSLSSGGINWIDTYTVSTLGDRDVEGSGHWEVVVFGGHNLAKWGWSWYWGWDFSNFLQKSEKIFVWTMKFSNNGSL